MKPLQAAIEDQRRMTPTPKRRMSGWKVVVLVIMLVFGAVLLQPATRTTAANNTVVLENQQPGTDQWQIGLPGYTRSGDSSGQVRGYASATSINKGQPITFYVTVSPVQTYNIDLYRIGWYQGKGGRLMQHIGPLNGVKQPSCPVDSTTGLIACPWSASYTLNVPTSWTSGIYLALLTNAQNYQSYITFVVRDDARQADLLYQQAVTTYQAYNDYPADALTGKSLYTGYGAKTALKTDRAVKVSFDRPYTYADHTGAGELFRWEIYFVRWMERSGYDVSYSTDLDTHTNGSRLLNYKGFLSVGHDEYWSKEMYDAAEAARDAGVNLGFFGANGVYWQVRFEPSASGVPNRVMVSYKDEKLDPIQGATMTVAWRRSLLNRPEQRPIGVQYDSYIDGAAPAQTYVVQNSGHWVYSGTGFHDGDGVPGILGYEMDRYFSNFPSAPAVNNSYALLSNSPYVDGGNTASYANSSIYQAASGAWVFGAGTIDWSWGLDNYIPPGAVNTGGHTVADPRIQQVTANILNTFISGTLPSINIAPPSNLTVSSMGATEIDLSWADNSNNEWNMVLERSTDSNFVNATALTLPADTTGYADTGLSPNTYYYRVKATNSGGNSAYSSTLAVVMPPATPTNLVATSMSSAQINLTWSDNAANEKFYTIERSTDNANWTVLDASVPADSTSYSSAGLSATTTYYYRVKATTAINESGYSNTATATTTNIVIYASDSFNRTVSNGWGSADVGGAYTLSGGVMSNFNVNGSVGTAVLADLTDRQAILNSVIQQDAAMTVRVATDKLAVGGSQKVRLRLRRVDAKNYYSFEVAFTTSAKLQAQIQAIVNNSQTNLQTITIAGLTHTPGQYFWIKAQVSGINPTTLNLKVWQDGTTEPSAWTLTATDSSSVLQVMAPIALMSSASSAVTNLPVAFSWDDLTVKDVPAAPTAPTSLTASPLATTQTYLTWTDKSKNKEFYTIERSTDGVKWTVVTKKAPASRPKYVDTGLKANSKYFYRIRSANANGNSNYSNVTSVTTYDLPNYIMDDD